MKKVISFSVFGKSKLYLEGMLENIELAKIYYPEWYVRCYISCNCPLLNKLESLQKENKLLEIEVMGNNDGVDRLQEDWTKKTSHVAMLHRFLPMSDIDVEYLIVRDADSRLSERESIAVSEWIKSEKLSMGIYESEYHYNGWVMGGMLGIKTDGGRYIPNIKEKIRNFLNIFHNYNQPFIFVDLIFLRDIIYPLVGHSFMGFGLNQPNVLIGDSNNYVGKVINEEWRYIEWKDQK